METYSSINAYGYHSPYQYDPHSLHWCFHCPSTTKWVSTIPLPPHPFQQPFYSTPPPPPNPTFAPVAQIEMISNSINKIQDILTEMKERNSRLDSSFSQIQSLLHELQLESMALEDAKVEEATVEDAADNIVVCIDESALDLIDGNARAVDNSEVETEYAENYSRTNVCKVFAEISNRKIAMEVGDSAQGDSVEIVTQVFDKMFQSLSAPKYGLEVREYKTPEYTHHTALVGSPSKLFEIEFHVSIVDFPFDPGSFMLTTSSHNYFHLASSMNLRMQSAVKLFKMQSLQLSFHTKSPLFSHCSVICVVQHPAAKFYKPFATFPGIYALPTIDRELWVPDSARLLAPQFTHQVMLARERMAIVITVTFASPPGDTSSNHVAFATPGLVQFLSGLNNKLADYIITCDIAQVSKCCGIDCLSSCLVKIEISQRLSIDFLVDLVRDPGFYPSSSINVGVLFPVLSPLLVSHMRQFQGLLMDTIIGAHLVHPNGFHVALRSCSLTSYVLNHKNLGLLSVPGSTDILLPWHVSSALARAKYLTSNDTQFIARMVLEVVDSARNDSMETGTQVFDEKLQPFYAVQCGIKMREEASDYAHCRVLLGSPDRLFAIACHVLDFPFDPGSTRLTTSVNSVTLVSYDILDKEIVSEQHLPCKFWPRKSVLHRYGVAYASPTLCYADRKFWVGKSGHGLCNREDLTATWLPRPLPKPTFTALLLVPSVRLLTRPKRWSKSLVETCFMFFIKKFQSRIQRDFVTKPFHGPLLCVQFNVLHLVLLKNEWELTAESFHQLYKLCQCASVTLYLPIVSEKLLLRKKIVKHFFVQALLCSHVPGKCHSWTERSDDYHNPTYAGIIVFKGFSLGCEVGHKAVYSFDWYDLDISRLEVGCIQLNFATLHLHILLRDVLHLITPDAYVKELFATLSWVLYFLEFASGDNKRLMNVLLDIIGTAVKLSTEGASSNSLAAKLESLQDHQAPEYFLVQSANYFCFCVHEVKFFLQSWRGFAQKLVVFAKDLVAAQRAIVWISGGVGNHKDAFLILYENLFALHALSDCIWKPENEKLMLLEVSEVGAYVLSQKIRDHLSTLIQLSREKLNLIMDSIEMALWHIKSDIVEVGLNLLFEVIKKVRHVFSLFKPGLLAYFLWDASVKLLQEFRSIVETNQFEVIIGIFSVMHTSNEESISNANVTLDSLFDIATMMCILPYFPHSIDHEDTDLAAAALASYLGLEILSTTLSVILYANLEDKVLIEGGSIVANVLTMDPFGVVSNYIWDPGKNTSVEMLIYI